MCYHILERRNTMKQYIKLNDNNKHLSLGNFCRIIKEISLDKSYANQTDIFCTIFNIDSANDSTVNNYCLGCRSISNTYKEQYQNLKKEYLKNKTSMNSIVLNIISILDGYIYTPEYETLKFINNHNNLKKLCELLYNIAKNDTTVQNKFTKKLHSLLAKNTYNECLAEILFYIILEKKQPIYIENIVNETIGNILTNTNISLNDLETFLRLQFNDGINYTYGLKQLTKDNNPYALFELGMLEFKGEITNEPRYNKSYEYFKKAATYNHPRANYLVAKMLLDQKIGNHTKEDLKLAKDYLINASNLGSIAALNALGLYYLNIEKNEDLAIDYFKKAIKNNYVYAYNNLGKIYEKKKNYTEAFNLYLKSASLEECWACNRIGEMYRLGLGTNIDYNKAFYYYNLALEVPTNKASLWAQYNLAKYFYLEGNYEAGVEKDETKAINLLAKSSDYNLLEATIELLYHYCNKYFKNNQSKTLNTINTLIDQIENHPNFNKEHKLIIEKNITKIKNKITINKDLLK